jgi:hypothetical protein
MRMHRRQAEVVDDAHIDAHPHPDAKRRRREQQKLDVQTRHHLAPSIP